ncbi:patatin-like phospholipase family protein [Pseudoalteromonas sp. G4]|uniref:patatin-like phospholipase family protein n=1 Tax=Pseudoalteromonas sp. G4 TaxID=2992761 RepID=UPI00237E8804|nr:patatin-like phospholipase family protein [Pseudoalteromonas sp. G4]MDE3273203.1 patatin-like phospholipase family protein [Pseudoalteromonas sp. G4]
MLAIRKMPVVLLIFFLIVSLPVLAKTQPKIGLVLGGGGAKGGAHIGVLKVLEQNNVKIDYIAGTSIGAYVGGMYALGYSADEIEAFMLNEDWDQGYSDDIPRQDLRYRDKELRDTYNLQLNLGIREGAIKSSKGFLVGQSMGRLLRNSTRTVHLFDDFDQLAIPYRAIATDLSTSEAVILSSGSIVKAMQASASVPGAVQPTEIDGRLLVDGGIANNLPIDVVKSMGADIVIVVDIGASLASSNQFTSTVEVLGQLSTILTNASTQWQKRQLTEHDIYIRPDIDDLSTTDWADLPESFTRGRLAAERVQDKIAALGVPQVEFEAYLNTKQQRSENWFKPLKNAILAISLDNQSAINNKIILQHFALKPGDSPSEHDIQLAVNRVYALDEFERVETEFKDTEQGRVLVLKTVGKSWGPNYIDFGANYQSDVTVNSVLSLDMAYTRSALNEYGGEWRTELSLGFEEYLATELYQPLNAEDDFYARTRLGFIRNRYTLQTVTQAYFDLDKNYLTGIAAFGYNFNNYWRLEAGVLKDNGTLEQKSIVNEKFDYDQSAFYSTLMFDNLDSISFPTKGNRLRIYFARAKEAYDDVLDPADNRMSTKFKIDWRGAFSLRHHAFVGTASYAEYDSDAAFTANTEQLGGFLNLSGYGKNVLIGPKKAFAAAIYQYDLGRDMLNMTSMPLYLGISAEAGNVWQVQQDIDLEDLIFASSLFVGTDTRFGPAAVGFGVTDNNESTFFISLGKHW